MAVSTVGKLVGFVEGTTVSLIRRALNSTDSFFSTGNNPLTSLFFKSVHAVDRWKEYKRPILATAGCCIIGAGTILGLNLGNPRYFNAEMKEIVI